MADSSARQNARNRRGQYEKMTPCARCGSRQNVFPQSDPDLPTNAWEDLCHKCEKIVKATGEQPPKK